MARMIWSGCPYGFSLSPLIRTTTSNSAKGHAPPAFVCRVAKEQHCRRCVASMYHLPASDARGRSQLFRGGTASPTDWSPLQRPDQPGI